MKKFSHYFFKLLIQKTQLDTVYNFSLEMGKHMIFFLLKVMHDMMFELVVEIFCRLMGVKLNKVFGI